MPPTPLWYGPSVGTLRRHAMTWLDEHAGAGPQRARFIVEHERHHEAIRRSWRRDHDPLRLVVSEFDDFALAVAERLDGPRPHIDALARRRLLEQALEAAEAPGPMPNARQHVSHVSALVRDLEGAGILDHEALRDRLETAGCPPTTVAFLGSVYEHYRELVPRLIHPAAVPHNERLRTLLEADRPLDALAPDTDAVVVAGMVEPTRLELAVIERLSATIPVGVILPTPDAEPPGAGVGSAVAEPFEAFRARGFEPTAVEPSDPEPAPLAALARSLYRPGEPVDTPDALRWVEPSTPDAEVRHLARQLRARLGQGGGDPDAITVLAPGLLSYRDAIADVFSSYGIPHAYRVGILLERTYVGQAVVEAVALGERPHAGRLAGLLSNPVVDVDGVDAGRVADVARRLYTDEVGALADELPTGHLDPVFDRLEAIDEAEPSAVVPALERLLETLGIEDRLDAFDDRASVDIGYERRAWNQVSSVFDSVAAIAETVEPADPLAEMRHAIEGVRVTPPRQTHEGQVDVVGLEDVLLADRQEVFVLGATAERLPRGDRRPRYFNRLGDALGVFDPDAKRDLDRYRFGMAMANASRMTITTPAGTVEDEPVLRSPIVEEVARVSGLEPEAVSDRRRGSREDLYRAMSGADPDRLEPALEAASAARHLEEERVEATMRGAVCGANRATARLTPHDGQLPSDALARLQPAVADSPFSHSRLSTYARCGFKHLLANGWGFEAEDELQAGLHPLVRGTLVHETVERFYRRLQERPGTPVDLRQFDRDRLETTLLRAGLSAVDDADATFEGAFRTARLSALFAGLATPAANPYEAPETALDGSPPRGTFVRFLETELERAEDGHRPTHLEVRFGTGDGVPGPGGRPLPIRGIIDRIDANPDGGIAVIDYKASSEGGVRRRERAVIDGIDFQLPMYALAAPTVVGADGDDPPPVRAQYYVLNDEPRVGMRRPLAERFEAIDVDALLTAVVPDRLTHLAEAIEAGAFQPAVVGPAMAGCAYCDFRDVCDVRHHDRYDVVDAIDRDGHPAYVPAGARPGESVDHLPEDVVDG